MERNKISGVYQAWEKILMRREKIWGPWKVSGRLIGWLIVSLVLTATLSYAIATPSRQRGDVQIIPQSTASPSATVEPNHYRCHAGEGDTVIFEPLDGQPTSAGLIVLHCVNCYCGPEK